MVNSFLVLRPRRLREAKRAMGTRMVTHVKTELRLGTGENCEWETWETHLSEILEYLSRRSVNFGNFLVGNTKIALPFNLQ